MFINNDKNTLGMRDPSIGYKIEVQITGEPRRILYVDHTSSIRSSYDATRPSPLSERDHWSARESQGLIQGYFFADRTVEIWYKGNSGYERFFMARVKKVERKRIQDAPDTTFDPMMLLHARRLAPRVLGPF